MTFIVQGNQDNNHIQQKELEKNPMHIQINALMKGILSVILDFSYICLVKREKP